MEKVKIADLPGTKVYLTEADSLSQQVYGISKEELLRKIRLWLLLSDHLMLAGSHIFKSRSIRSILEENPSLLESGVIVPDLREECRDFVDYVKLKQEEGDPVFRGAPPELIEKARFLNERTRQAVLWTAEPVSQAFRDSLVTDLMNSNSVLRRKLIGVDAGSLSELTWKLGNTPFLTREILADLAQRHIGRKRGVLLKYANILYYLWGATHLESEPVLHAQAFEWGREKLFASSKNLARTNEVPLFRSALGAFGISDQVLDRLAIPMVLELRKEKTARLFRNKWHKIIERAKRGASIDKDVAEYENFGAELLEVVTEAIGMEKEKRRKFRIGKRILFVSSFITSIMAGFVTDPALGFDALILQLATIDPLLAAIERKLGGTEISLFCARLQKPLVG